MSEGEPGVNRSLNNLATLGGNVVKVFDSFGFDRLLPKRDFEELPPTDEGPPLQRSPSVDAAAREIRRIKAVRTGRFDRPPQEPPMARPATQLGRDLVERMSGMS